MNTHDGPALETTRPVLPAARSQLPLVIYRDVEIPMRDETVLRADMWLPDHGRRCPVLLQRTPYDKSFAPIAHGRLAPGTAVERGYGVIIQDVRGRFASDGAFEPFAHERDDGVDTIAWIRDQPFSDGRVAMYGASYPGAVQLLAAAENPQGLAAIVPDVTSIDFHGWMYQSGAFQLGFALNWAIALAGEELTRRERDGAEVTALRGGLDALSADVASGYSHLPVAEQALLDELVPAFGSWLTHPVRDGFWDRLSTADDLGRIGVPALHITGWYDVFVRDALAQFTRLRQSGRAPQRLLIGPWAHAGWGDALGELIYGSRASRDELDLTKLHLDFCDAALSGTVGSLDSPVRLFTMGVNEWRDEAGWPPAGVRTERLHLRADGRLTGEPPATDERSRSFRYDPRDPVPTTGGATFLPGHTASIAVGSRDQRPLHERGDILLYLGEPLSRPLEVTGDVSVTLHATTDASDTDWTAKLLDVHPDGRAMGIADGIIRARYSRAAPGLLEPGRPHRLSIAVGPTSMVFAAGHRVALEVSSSNFPRFDRNANSDVHPARARAADIRIATQVVHHDSMRPSFLELPVRGR